MGIEAGERNSTTLTFVYKTPWIGSYCIAEIASHAISVTRANASGL